MKIEHTIGVIIICLLMVDVYLEWETLQAVKERK